MKLKKELRNKMECTITNAVYAACQQGLFNTKNESEMKKIQL